MNKKLIGVDLGGTTIKFAILTDQAKSNKSGRCGLTFWMKVLTSFPILLNPSTITLICTRWTAASLSGSAMGTPGTVNREEGTVIGAYNLNWKTLQPVKEQIEKGTGLKFALDNDATVPAWANAGKVPVMRVTMWYSLRWELASAVGSSLTASWFMVSMVLVVKLAHHR